MGYRVFKRRAKNRVANEKAISSLLFRVSRAMTEEMTPASNVEEELSRVNYGSNGRGGKNWEINASINSSSAHAPPPTPGNRGTFVHVVSPGGGAFAILSWPRGLGFSVPRGDPRAFDTSVKATTSWEKNVRGQLNMISVQEPIIRVQNPPTAC